MNKDLERYYFRIMIERDALELAMYDTKGVTEEGLANVPYILNTLQIRYERSCYFHTIRNTVVTLFNKLNKKYDLVDDEPNDDIVSIIKEVSREYLKGEGEE